MAKEVGEALKAEMYPCHAKGYFIIRLGWLKQVRESTKKRPCDAVLYWFRTAGINGFNTHHIRVTLLSR